MTTRRIFGTLTLAAGAVCAVATVAFSLPPLTTTPKTASAVGSGQAEVFGLAAGCHATFDRFVVRTRFGIPGYDVRYVAQVIQDGSGLPVALLGAARLRVVLRPALAHTPSGAPLMPRALTPRCPNLRKVRVAGDFEGVVTFGLGLTHKTGFRVFRLNGPRRVVIDIAH